jgi:thioredoxin-dependent peroxiredoxin
MSLGRLFLLPVLLLAISLPAAAASPAVGQAAPDFTVTALDGSTLSLSSLTSSGRLIIVVLRGYPGYQCPFSQQAFQSYQQQAAQFAALGTQLLFVYPGTGGSNLANDAASMIGSQPLASNVHVVLDPDYNLTNLYGVRWDATDQTAYPATFLVSSNHSVAFAHVGQLESDFTPVPNLLSFVHAAVYPNQKP